MVSIKNEQSKDLRIRNGIKSFFIKVSLNK